MKRNLLTLGLIFVACGSADAASYYVRKSGSDKNNGRSRNQAFQTINMAASVANQGDSIYVGAGTYDEQIEWRPAGTSNSFSIIYGDIGGSVTGDKGEVIVRPPANRWAFYATNANNLLVYSITFAKNPANLGNAFGCAIINCQGYAYFLNCKFQDLYYGIYGTSRETLLYAANCQFQGNYYGIYSSRAKAAYVVSSLFGAARFGVYSNDSSVTYVANCAFDSKHPVTGNVSTSNGVYAIRTELTVANSTFQSPSNGVYGHGVTSAAISNCKFKNIGSYGVTCSGTKLQVSDSSFDGGTNGCMLDNTSGGSSLLTNVTIDGMNNGLYMPGGDVQFAGVSITNCNQGIYSYVGEGAFTLNAKDQLKLTNNKTGIYCYHNVSGKFLLDVSGYDFSGNATGIRTAGADVRLSQCSFDCESTGVYIQTSNSTEIRECKFTGNPNNPSSSNYGLYVDANKLTLRDCYSANNRNGYYIYNRANNTPDLKNLVADSNVSVGLYMRGGSWNWNRSDGNSFTNSHYGVYTTYVNWTVDGIDTGNTCSYSLTDNNGNLSITNSRISGKTIGVYANRSESLSIADSKVVQCGSYGVLCNYTPKTSFSRITVADNAYGLYCNANTGEGVYIADSEFVKNSRDALVLSRATFAKGSKNLNIAGNQRYGLRMNNADLTLHGEMNMQFTDNNVGIYLTNGNLSLTKMSIKGNKFPVYMHGGELFVSNCDISGESYGIYGSIKGKCHVEDTTIQDASYGLYVNVMAELKNPVEIVGVTVKNARTYGIYIRNTINPLPKVEITKCSLRDCGYGVYTNTATCSVKHADIRGSKTRAVHQHGGNLTLTDSHIEGSNSWAVYGSGESLDIQRVTIANANYGVNFASAKGSIVNSVVRGCNYGIYLYQPDADYKILQTTLADIRYYGVWHENGNTLIRNSIVDAGYYGLWKRTENGSITHDHNLIYSAREAFKNILPDPTEITKSPVFVSAATGDVHLAAGSPAINAGTDLSSLIVSDIEGNARPSFRRFELGAYEYTKPSGSLRVLDWDEVAR